MTDVTNRAFGGKILRGDEPPAVAREIIKDNLILTLQQLADEQAKRLDRLRAVNRELLEAAEAALAYFDGLLETRPIAKLEKAVTRAQAKEEP